MRDHLYNELNYAKWICSTCGLTSCNSQNLHRHFATSHVEQTFNTQSIRPLTPDNEIEQWVCF